MRKYHSKTQKSRSLPMNSRIVDALLLLGGGVSAILFTLALMKLVIGYVEAHKI